MDLKADLKKAEESYIELGKQINNLTTEAKRLEGVVLYLRQTIQAEETPKDKETLEAESCEECKVVSE